jgi:hypothetical protein
VFAGLRARPPRTRVRRGVGLRTPSGRGTTLSFDG